MPYTVAALYRFTKIADAPAFRAEAKTRLAEWDICGSLLVAPEGINGTLAGSAENIEAMLEFLRDKTGLPRDDVKFSTAHEKPFNRLKVRLKREIITFNQPAADPAKAGTTISAQEWNTLLDDPDVLLLDTRNAYETAIGVFKGAEDPGIQSFTQFANYVRENLAGKKDKKIAMYCTGGIRCEKASAFMRAEGFETVYQLKGGILKYLEEIPAEASRWQGECYVFDKRMAVGQGLSIGSHRMCYCCGAPLSEADRAHPHYEEGVSCAGCFANRSVEDKQRFRMRQKQMAD